MTLNYLKQNEGIAFSTTSYMIRNRAIGKSSSYVTEVYPSFNQYTPAKKGYGTKKAHRLSTTA